MPFLPVEDSFREGIKDDIKIFDHRRTLLIHHIKDNATVDWTTAVSTRVVETITVEDCLFRQPSRRNGSSIPQLHERSLAVQKDSFDKSDTIIEVPMREGVAVRVNDIIEDPISGVKWKVAMLDIATLETRFRLGCSRFN